MNPTTRSAPRVDAGLLLLRLAVGLSLAIFFSLPKLIAATAHIHTGQPWPFIDFNRTIELPAPVLIAYYQSLNESLGALLLAFGFLTRPAALSLAIGFAAATYCSLKAGEQIWLLAAAYCLMAATLALTGPGRFSVDSRFASESKLASARS
jgi:uncharacterized membrane protein YphA (DoxX/SURF4 family)